MTTTVSDRPVAGVEVAGDPVDGYLARKLKALFVAIDAFVLVRHHRKGAAMLRIGIGFVSLMYYVSNYTHRQFLWGPNSSYPIDLVSDRTLAFLPSLYPLFPSQVGFEVLFHLGIVLAAAFMVGAGGRWLTALHYLFLFSLYQRNPLLIDGGDNITYLVLLYLIAVDTTAFLAIRRRYPISSLGDRFKSITFMGSPNVTRIGNVFHNFGVVFIVGQVLVMYIASAMYKIQGEMWQDGTALYYIMRVPEFSWPGVSEYIYRNGTLIVVLTYATVFFQIFFVALVAKRSTRAAAVVIAATFHIGIWIFMGLTSFSLTVIAIEMIILDDDHYARMKLGYDRLRVRLTRPSLGRTTLRPQPAVHQMNEELVHS